MAYNPKSDREIKVWKISITDTETAIIRLCAYNDGDPRLAIGITEIKKEDGTVVHARIKRWPWGSLLKLREVLDEAIELMDSLAAGKKKNAA